MKIGIKWVLAVGILLTVLGTSLACSNASAANNAPVPAAAVSTSNIFKVTNLSVNPSEVNAGVQALITAKVTNTGDTDNQYQGNIRIDNTSKSSLPGFLPSDQVKISAGSTELISVTTTINSPGTYKVTWDGVSQTLKVNLEQPSAAGQNTTANPAPDFTAVDVVTGKKVSLSQFVTPVILLNFVNYGCSPDLNQKVGDQLLAIRDLTKQRKDFTPISVFCGCCPPDTLKQFAKSNNFDWPWILDTDYSIVNKYGNYLQKYGYPTLIFIDKDRLINEVAGSSNLSTLNDKINSAVRAAK